VLVVVVNRTDEDTEISDSVIVVKVSVELYGLDVVVALAKSPVSPAEKKPRWIKEPSE
jgi:hypothetical protein